MKYTRDSLIYCNETNWKVDCEELHVTYRKIRRPSADIYAAVCCKAQP